MQYTVLLIAKAYIKTGMHLASSSKKNTVSVVLQGTALSDRDEGGNVT
jgi:hypothetical protein